MKTFTSRSGNLLSPTLPGWSVIRNNGVHEVYDTEAEAQAAFTAAIETVSACVRTRALEPTVQFLPLVTARGKRGVLAEILSTEPREDGSPYVHTEGSVRIFRR